MYYNYRIGFGSKWDYLGDDKDNIIRNNRFLTEYRMIHNMPVDKVKYTENPRDHFADYIATIDSTKDPLFERGDYERE